MWRYDNVILTNNTNTTMGKDVLFVTTFDVLIINRLIRLAVNPSDIERSVLQAAVEVLNEAHHPCHFDATFDCELPANFHLPSRTGTTPRTNFAIPGDDDDLFKINQTTEVRQLAQRG